MSSKWRPVVGSSSIYSVLPVPTFESSVESFTRWASPPLSVVACCPSVMYPSPTSKRVLSFRSIPGISLKKSTASVTVISSTSAIDFPL